MPNFSPGIYLLMLRWNLIEWLPSTFIRYALMAGVLVASGLTIDEQFAVFNIQSETGFRVIVRWRMGSGVKRTLPMT